jgi:uncharacterized membrane protein YfcA
MEVHHRGADVVSAWFLGYLVLGAFAGFFAGLLGVGGGAIMVPMLAMMFAAQGFADTHLMHVALGTSMDTLVRADVWRLLHLELGLLGFGLGLGPLQLGAGIGLYAPEAPARIAGDDPLGG